MEFIQQIIDFVLHIDIHLNEIILTYGAWTYGILFGIIFLETGFVVTPFLPGDSTFRRRRIRSTWLAQ
jgi:membrane-associated protein